MSNNVLDLNAHFLKSLLSQLAYIVNRSKKTDCEVTYE
jgi:hypothetical protein